MASYIGTQGTNPGDVATEGKMGIGTTSPGQMLAVHDSSTASSTPAIFRGAADQVDEYVQINVGTANHQLNMGTLLASVDTGFLSMAADGAPTNGKGLFIQEGGNVGLGTTSPAVRLDVAMDAGTIPTLDGGTIALFRNNDAASDVGRVVILGGNGTGGYSCLDFGDSDDPDAGQIYYSHQYDSMTFKTGGVWPRMTIDSSGRVGIGTDSPSEKLHVVGDNYVSAIFMSGNVGIGNNGPNEKLEVNGNIKASGYKSSDGTFGATADVDVAKVGGGTRQLHFKNGLYTGYTDL